MKMASYKNSNKKSWYYLLIGKWIDVMTENYIEKLIYFN